MDGRNCCLSGTFFFFSTNHAYLIFYDITRPLEVRSPPLPMLVLESVFDECWCGWSNKQQIQQVEIRPASFKVSMLAVFLDIKKTNCPSKPV